MCTQAVRVPFMTTTGPGVLDALSLLAHVADGLGVATARDTHLAWVDRVHGLVDRPLGPTSRVVGGTHRTIARSVYAGVGLGLRTASVAFDVGARAGLDERPGWRLDDHPRGRFARSAVNGLIGDRLATERPQWALPTTARVDGRDVALDDEGLAAAYPDAGRRVVVFLHGLCEDESYWNRRRAERGTTYAETLGREGWTPVMLRANTGLPLRESGVALAAFLQQLVEHWPVELERLAIVGHSMGGLVARAASAVSTDSDAAWVDRVSDVVTLGTPHVGAPLAAGIGHGARGLARVPETAGFGRLLDWRSVGVHDLVEGLGEDVPALPHARYRLVSATLAASARHPVSAFLGDILVRQPSAYGRRRGRDDLFPGAEVLHLPRAHHFTLLNDARVEEALRRWLA